MIEKDELKKIFLDLYRKHTVSGMGFMKGNNPYLFFSTVIQAASKADHIMFCDHIVLEDSNINVQVLDHLLKELQITAHFMDDSSMIGMRKPMKPEQVYVFSDHDDVLSQINDSFGSETIIKKVENYHEESDFDLLISEIRKQEPLCIAIDPIFIHEKGHRILNTIEAFKEMDLHLYIPGIVDTRLDEAEGIFNHVMSEIHEDLKPNKMMMS